MDTVIVNRDQYDEWEAYIEGQPGAIAWQSYAWSDVVKKHYTATFYPIAAYEAGQICGILPLYRVPAKRGASNLISVPYAVAGGIVADCPDASESLLNRAKDLMKEHGAGRIVLKQYKTCVEADLLTDTNYYNRELSLTGDTVRLFESLPEETRREVEKGANRSLVLEYPWRDIDAFYKLLLQYHHKRGIPCASKEWIADLVGCGMYSMAILMRDAQILCGTMVKEFKDTISFPFTCVNPSVTETHPPYILYWRLIEHFAREGMQIFHSGRIPVTEEAEPYRRAWGGKAYTYYYQYFPNLGGSTEFRVKRGTKRRIAQTAWRCLPAQVARVLGPVIVKRYP